MRYESPESASGRPPALAALNNELATAVRRCQERSVDRLAGVVHPVAALAAWDADLRRIEWIAAILPGFGGDAIPGVEEELGPMHELLAEEMAREGGHGT